MIITRSISVVRRCAPVVLALGLAACAASGGSTGGDHVAPDFDFGAVSTVHLDTPIGVSMRGPADADIRRVVEQELREFLSQGAGWTPSGSAAAADAVVRFELTDWESGSAGSRVGGTLELVRPEDGTVVYRSSQVYPSRFGAPAQGTARDLLDDLFRDLLAATQD